MQNLMEIKILMVPGSGDAQNDEFLKVKWSRWKQKCIMTNLCFLEVLGHLQVQKYRFLYALSIGQNGGGVGGGVKSV